MDDRRIAPREFNFVIVIVTRNRNLLHIELSPRAD
jgi:hypothetical protein